MIGSPEGYQPDPGYPHGAMTVIWIILLDYYATPPHLLGIVFIVEFRMLQIRCGDPRLIMPFMAP